MSLLQKASIITTPTAYAEDYLYSIKPVLSFGSELVTDGNFNSNANWSQQDGNISMTVANNVATITMVGASTYMFQTINTVSGRLYKGSFVAKTGTNANHCEINLRNGNNSASALHTFLTYGEFASSSAFNSNTTSDGKIEFAFIANNSTTTIRLVTNKSSTPAISEWQNISVKEITDADFDFDRNSTGTRVNEDYLIEDVPYNLLAYSQDFTQWTNSNSTDSVSTTLSPDGSAFSTNFAENTATAQHKLTRSVSFDGSSTYTFSVFVKSNGRDIFLDVGNNTRFGGRASFNLTTGVATSVMGTPSIENFGNGWFRCMVTGASTSAGSTTLELLTFNGSTNSYEGDGSSGVFVWGAQVVKGDQPKDYLKTTDRLDIPRIDYTNGEPSILLEKSRTNLVTYSNDFTNAAWDKDNSTITANSTTSPEGLVNASKLTEDTATSSHRVEETVTVSNGATVTCSVYAKKGERNFILLFESNSADGAYFNLDTGKFVRVDGTPVDYNIQDLKNGWYRCSIVVTVPSTSCRFQIYMTQTSNTSSYTGDGSSSMFIYGAQVEVGSYSTSLIHTSGSTVTRSSDVANNAGNSDLFNDSEGVLYAEIAALSNVASHRRITISDGTNNNRIVVGYNTTTNQIFYFVKVGGSTVASGNYTPINITEFKKIAIKYKVNDFAFYVDGIVRHTDSSGAVFSANTLNSLQFAQGSGDDLFFLGRAKMVAVFKEALTDLELEKLTGYNNHELYMNYYNRLSYLGLVEEYNVESDINNYIL